MAAHVRIDDVEDSEVRRNRKLSHSTVTGKEKFTVVLCHASCHPTWITGVNLHTVKVVLGH